MNIRKCFLRYLKFIFKNVFSYEKVSSISFLLFLSAFSSVSYGMQATSVQVIYNTEQNYGSTIDTYNMCRDDVNAAGSPLACPPQFNKYYVYSVGTYKAQYGGGTSVQANNCSVFGDTAFASCVEYHYYWVWECPPSSENPPTQCVGKHDGKRLGLSGCNASFVGNPIDTATGNKVQVELDYRGSEAFPLSVSRTYNSLAGEWVFMGGISINSETEVAVTRPDGKTHIVNIP